MLSKQAQDIVTEYKARNDMNIYDEMSWEEINAYHSWDCKDEEDLIKFLADDDNQDELITLEQKVKSKKLASV